MHKKSENLPGFRSEQGKLLLDCSQLDVVRFVAWLRASGQLVCSAVKGLQGLQAPLVPRDLTRAAIPAQVIYDMLISADFSLRSVELEPLVALRTARACLATVIAFLFFARPGANARTLNADLVVTSTPQVGIQLLPRGRKGQGRLQPHKLAPLFVPADKLKPLGGLPHVDLPALLVKFKQLRDNSFGGRTPVHLWALPGEQARHFGPRSQNAWLKTALALTVNSPPPGHTWTGHSMRKGAASAASAAGVPLPKICHYGGWSVTSDVVSRDYIDPTYPVTPAGSFFFSWLAPGNFSLVAGPAS